MSESETTTFEERGRNQQYQGQNIGGGRAEFGWKIGVERVEISHIDEKELRVVE